MWTMGQQKCIYLLWMKKKLGFEISQMTVQKWRAQRRHTETKGEREREQGKEKLEK